MLEGQETQEHLELLVKPDPLAVPDSKVLQGLRVRVDRWESLDPKEV